MRARLRYRTLANEVMPYLKLGEVGLVHNKTGDVTEQRIWKDRRIRLGNVRPLTIATDVLLNRLAEAGQVLSWSSLEAAMSDFDDAIALLEQAREKMQERYNSKEVSSR